MDLFDLAAKITLDSDEYERGLNEASRKTSSFGDKLKKGFSAVAKAGTVALGAAAAGVTALVKSSIDAYANYEQLVGGVETLFGESADKVQEYAANAYKTAGLSANEYMETVTSFSASLLQSLGGDTNAAAEYADMAITDMADNANKMGTSMEAIQNAYQGFAKQNYTMLDNLKLGYGGTKSEMERLILDAENLDSTFKAARDENGNLAMSYADVVDAIHIVQTEMGITGTTAKEASETISGSVSAMKASWQNLLITFGNGKDVKAAMSNLVSDAKNVVKNVMPIVKTALSGIGEFVKEIGPVIVSEFPNLVKEILPGLLDAAVSLVGNLAKALPGMLKALLTTIGGFMDTLSDWLRQKSPMLGTAFDGLRDGAANAFKKLAELWENTLKPTLSKFVEWLKGGSAGAKAFKTAVIALVAGISTFSIILKIVEMFKALQAAVTVVKGAFTAFNAVLAANPIGIVIAAIAALVAAFVYLWNTNEDFRNFWINTWSAIKTVASDVANAIAKFVTEDIPNAFQRAIDFLASLPSLALNWGRDLIQNFISGIKNSAGELWSSVKGLAQGVSNFLGFSEPKEGPLSNFHTYAPDMMALFAQGIRDNEKIVTDQLARSFDFSDMFNVNAAGTGVSTPVADYGGDIVTINVYADKGQDVEELAQKVEQIFINRSRRRSLLNA